MTQVQFEEVYKRFKESGLNVSDFCINEGFTESRFYYWQKKLKSANKTSGLIPLLIDKSGSVPLVNHGHSKVQPWPMWSFNSSLFKSTSTFSVTTCLDGLKRFNLFS